MEDTWALLPVDIQWRAFDFLAPAECDRVATTSKRFLELSRLSKSWFRAARSRHKSPPNSPSKCRVICLTGYRPRCDGVYISKCQYVRIVAKGQSLTETRGFVPVTYFRFLRFFNDGQAVMATAPADMSTGDPRMPKKVYLKLVKIESAVEGDSADEDDVPKPSASSTSRRRNPPIVIPDENRQWHVCQWSDTGPLISLWYRDKSDTWFANLSLSHGATVCSELQWDRYCYWSEVEKERWLTVGAARIADLMSVVQDRSDVEGLNQRQIFESELWNMRDKYSAEGPVTPSRVPQHLINEIPLNHEHFPVMKFKISKPLGWLF